jgi:hypothetical protein
VRRDGLFRDEEHPGDLSIAAIADREGDDIALARRQAAIPLLECAVVFPPRCPHR